MGRRSARAGAGPSPRQLRVGEELRHVLAELLMRGGLRAPALADAQLTVSEVRVSADLRHAVVFVTELGGELPPERLEALERSAPQLRGEVTRRMRLKYAPDLTFRPDRSFAEAARIEMLLAEERAAVGAASHEDDDGAE
ncbi:MAG TPA: 30S ribosome-binding factor RbfA [Geminicoccaceae bacterium]|nr:30S ribosome-binding factor RbfA [Geminicoccaceae bacterium]